MSARFKSPFPGMDPFLEVNPRWQEFHGWFIRELARLHSGQARDMGCRIGVERDVYQREPSGDLVLIGEPDSLVLPELGTTRWDQSIDPSHSAVLAAPGAVHEIVLDVGQMETYKQDYLVVREMGRFTSVIAVLELLSFANKQGSYVPRYREKRGRLLTSHTHFMEIDFLRAGDNPSRQLFPELQPAPYFIFLARKTGCGRNEEAYPIRLQDRLPLIGLPTGPGRPDLQLDLAAAFESAFELCTQTEMIDYQTESVPEPPLTAEDIAWMKTILAGIREKL